MLIGKNEKMPAGSFRIDQDARVKACASQAAIKLEARQLFSDALRIRPDLAIVQYNLGVLDWNTLANCSTDDSCEHDIEANQAMLKIREQAEAEFVTALKSDPSIPGAHIELGNMAVWRGDFATAIDQFSTTVRLAPQSLEAAFNLGQALALTDHESEAENAYRQAIRLAPVNSIPSMEAHLALGYLYYQQGKPAQAGIEYEQTQEQLQQARSDDSYYLSSRSFYSEGALELALTKYEIDAGQLISASQRAHSNSYFSPLQSYLAWLIGSAYGLTTTVQSEVYYTITGDYAATPFIAWSYGDVNAMTWNDLLKQCKTSAVDDFRTWGSSANPCLPSDPQKRISAVFEIIQRRMQQRLFFTDVAPGEGMACPYILTYDNQSRQWSFDTTILYQLIGPQSETAQARRLSRFDGRLWLQEVEPERSYVDSLTVRLTMTDGREIVLKPNEPLLDTADGQYLVLHQGDQLLLTFDVPKGSLPAREAWVVATGYYIPLHR